MPFPYILHSSDTLLSVIVGTAELTSKTLPGAIQISTSSLSIICSVRSAQIYIRSPAPDADLAAA